MSDELVRIFASWPGRAMLPRSRSERKRLTRVPPVAAPAVVAAKAQACHRMTAAPVKLAQSPQYPVGQSPIGDLFGADMTSFCAPLATLALATLLFWPSAAASDDVIQAKLGMEWLSAEQQQVLWRRVEQYAGLESFASFCGRPSHIERRVVNAVQPCIAPATLQLVVSRFRKNLQEKKASIGADKSVCEEQKMKTLVKKIHTAIDTMVDEMTRMCRSCLIC
jgi:hypothetical protein